jgi:SAM-dependent methyltransferase
VDHLAHYIIRGGVAGRERLRFMARVLQPGTDALLDRVGVAPGARCLDVGCGGGDISTVLARRVGPSGSVIGVDLDAEKLDMARREAGEQQLTNVEYRAGDLRDVDPPGTFDLIYARFVLTHLPDPAAAVTRFRGWLRAGGAVVVEDIDYQGCFVWPPLDAFQRYCALYCETVQRRGGDPFIGPRLPQLLQDGGFTQVSVAMNQPLGLDADVKVIHLLTLENIADAVVASSLATREEIDRLTAALRTIAADHTTLAAAPRIVQAWGRR